VELLIISAGIAFNFLKRSVSGLLIGIFIAELLIEKGIVEKVSFIGKPFVKLSNLPAECALTFATAFLNTRAANAMLVDFYREGKIGKRELYIASLMNAFPAMVRHWNSLIPVLLATLGRLGLLYFGILVFIGLIQTTVFAVAGKILIKNPRNALAKTKKTSTPILKTMIIVTYITALLIAVGFFNHLSDLVRSFAESLPFSPEELSVALSAMASSIAAYTLGANLLKAGLISEKALIRALLLGSIFANITFLRVLIPYYVGLYGPKDGTKLMLISMTTRSVIIAVMGVVL